MYQSNLSTPVLIKQEQSLQPIEAETGLTSTPIQAFKTWMHSIKALPPLFEWLPKSDQIGPDLTPASKQLKKNF